jgi:hypothetical protein
MPTELISTPTAKAYSTSSPLLLCTRLDMFIDMKFHIDIRGGHINTKSCHRFIKHLTAPTPK